MRANKRARSGGLGWMVGLLVVDKWGCENKYGFFILSFLGVLCLYVRKGTRGRGRWRKEEID